MDAIAAEVCTKRKGTALAYLASPATCYPIPAAAVQDAVDRLGAPTCAFGRGLYYPSHLRSIHRAQFLARDAALCTRTLNWHDW